MTILAQAATTSPANPEPPGFVKFIASSGFYVILMALVVWMLFMSSSTKRKQERERTELINKLKKNDEIQTIGGIIGKVIDTRDDRVLVKVDESSNTKIWFSRNAIHRVLNQPEKAEAK